MTVPLRIWAWPNRSATGVVAWGSGCFRLAPYRPLDDHDGPTGAAYVDAAVADDLLAALEDALEAWEDHNKWGDMMDGAWASDARKAIAKAKGGAQ
jgi:hypothetical protein